MIWCFFFFFQAEDGIRDAQESRGLGDVYKRQEYRNSKSDNVHVYPTIRLFVTTSADLLADIRSHSGTPRTVGLSDSVIAAFTARDATLSRAIAEAHEAHISLRSEVGGVTLMLIESGLV